MNLRNTTADIVKDSIRGPLYGENEVLSSSPLDFYTTGILFPNQAERIEEDLLLTTEFKPSALGISIVLEDEFEFKVSLSAAKYTFSIKEEFKAEAKEHLDKGKRIPKYFKNFNRNEIKLEGLALELSEGMLTVKGSDGTILSKGSKILEFEIEKNLLCKVIQRNIRQNNAKSKIVTITMINTYSLGEEDVSNNDPDYIFFQPSIKCESDSPVFLPFDNYSDLNKISDLEVLNNKLLYRNYLTYGTGHGCSVDWKEPEEKNYKTKSVESKIIPDCEVNGNDFEPKELIDEENNIDCEVLYMKQLAGEDYTSENEKGLNRKEIIAGLDTFIKIYDDWIITKDNELEESISKVRTSPANKNILIKRGESNLDKCRDFSKRMRKGVTLLSENDFIYKAFIDANRAMYMQRCMSDFISKRKLEKEKIFPGKDDVELPNFKNDYHYKNENKFLAKWRPFQLAFLLSQIEGIINPKSKDRDTIDLLWFSTGGGKTEAYLGLIAIVIFYRRLNAKSKQNDPDLGAGVTAFMRYTLRLLNKQQFNRASPLICACELIRRENEADYGKIQISLGIWVGSSLTPNQWEGHDDAFLENFEKLILDPSTDQSKFSLPIFECPCCGTRLVQESVNGIKKGEWGLVGKWKRGSTLRNPPFYLFCTNQKCQFHIAENEKKDQKIVKEKKIPIYFVDQEVYEQYPTLVFATVDKFASINWNNDCYKLFNLQEKNDKLVQKYDPPNLIIQDELHLIDSSLGTIYGIYEMLIDTFCSLNGEKPKIVAATATAKNAEQQSKLLYSRENFMQFPPPGIDIDDSFYSRKKTKDLNARKYIGFQPSGFTNTVAQIRLIGNLMQKIPVIKSKNNDLDKYYTLLVYFNTLRELGKFRTLLEDDIVDYRKFLSKDNGSLNTGFREEQIKELSSALTADEISLVLENLEKEELPQIDYAKASKYHDLGFRTKEDLEIIYNDRSQFLNKFNNKECFEKLGLIFTEDKDENLKTFAEDFKKIFNITSSVSQVASATNMISVGIDIPRLNIMQVTGQPRSHSEYIQASSRVGRKYPGIVITTYNPSKNRDRSHYEKFLDYHQAFYKNVEDTTVTPYSLPALEKALPGVIIGIIKYRFLKLNETPRFDAEISTGIDELRSELKDRATLIFRSINQFDPQELESSLKNIDTVVDILKEKWKKAYDIYKNDLTIPSYSYLHQNLKKEERTKRLFRSLYIRPEDKESYNGELDDKITCMTTLRSVEVNSVVKLNHYFS